MPGNKANLEITATDKASAKIKKVGRNAEGLGGKLGAVNKKFGAMGMGSKLGAAAAGVAVAGLGMQMSSMARDFDRNFSQVMTLLPGISEKVFGDMKSDLKELSRELGVNLVDATTGLYNAISAGVPQKNVFEFMRVASKAAIAGGNDLTSTVTTLAQVMNVYGVGVEEAEDISDKLFTTVKLGMTTLPQLSSSLANVLPVAQSLGVSFGEVSSMLAVLTASTGQTAESITRLRGLFTAASKDTSILAQAIKRELGASFSNLIASGKTTSEIMQELRDRMPLEDFRNLFRRTEAQAAALLITGENAVKVAGAYDQMTTSIGATEEAFKTVDESMAQAWDKSIENLKTTGVELGEVILPFMVRFLQLIVDVSDKMKEAWEWLSQVQGDYADLKADPQFAAFADRPKAESRLGKFERIVFGTGGEGVTWKDLLDLQKVIGTFGAAELGEALADAMMEMYRPGAVMPTPEELKIFRERVKAATIRRDTEGALSMLGIPMPPGESVSDIDYMNELRALAASDRARFEYNARAATRSYRDARYFPTTPEPALSGLPDFKALQAAIDLEKAEANAAAAESAKALADALNPLVEETNRTRESMTETLEVKMREAAALGITLNLEEAYNELIARSTEELAALEEALKAAIESEEGVTEAQNAYNDMLEDLGLDWQNEVSDAIEDLGDEAERQWRETKLAQEKAAAEEKRRLDELIRVNAIQVRLASKSLEQVAGSQELIGMTRTQMQAVYTASGLNTVMEQAARSGFASFNPESERGKALLGQYTGGRFDPETGEVIDRNLTGYFAQIKDATGMYGHLEGQVARVGSYLTGPTGQLIQVGPGGTLNIVEGNFFNPGTETGLALIREVVAANEATGATIPASAVGN